MKTKMVDGFTLIELMVVVAIIGVLATIAIPTFLRFLHQTKTSEALINMKAIGDGAISWYNSEHNDSLGDPMPRHFPTGNSPTSFLSTGIVMTPGDIPCNSLSAGALYKKNSQHWNSEPWISVHFSVTKAHYYQYWYDADGTNQAANLRITTLSDLDCDGNFAGFLKQATINTTSDEVEIAEVISCGSFGMAGCVPGDPLD